MIEKTNLKSDAEIGFGIVTIDCGVDQFGWPIKRRFLPEQLRSDQERKVISVPYEEWRVLPDGRIYEEFYWQKKYCLTDNHDTGDLRYTQWMTAVVRMIATPIASTLANLPVEAQDQFLINATPQ